MFAGSSLQEFAYFITQQLTIGNVTTLDDLIMNIAIQKPALYDEIVRSVNAIHGNDE